MPWRLTSVSTSSTSNDAEYRVWHIENGEWVPKTWEEFEAAVPWDDNEDPFDFTA